MPRSKPVARRLAAPAEAADRAVVAANVARFRRERLVGAPDAPAVSSGASAPSKAPGEGAKEAASAHGATAAPSEPVIPVSERETGAFAFLQAKSTPAPERSNVAPSPTFMSDSLAVSTAEAKVDSRESVRAKEKEAVLAPKPTTPVLLSSTPLISPEAIASSDVKSKPTAAKTAPGVGNVTSAIALAATPNAVLSEKPVVIGADMPSNDEPVSQSVVVPIKSGTRASTAPADGSTEKPIAITAGKLSPLAKGKPQAEASQKGAISASAPENQKPASSEIAVAVMPNKVGAALGTLETSKCVNRNRLVEIEPEQLTVAAPERILVDLSKQLGAIAPGSHFKAAPRHYAVTSKANDAKLSSVVSKHSESPVAPKKRMVSEKASATATKNTAISLMKPEITPKKLAPAAGSDDAGSRNMPAEMREVTGATQKPATTARRFDAARGLATTPKKAAAAAAAKLAPVLKESSKPAPRIDKSAATSRGPATTVLDHPSRKSALFRGVAPSASIPPTAESAPKAALMEAGSNFSALEPKDASGLCCVSFASEKGAAARSPAPTATGKAMASSRKSSSVPRRPATLVTAQAAEGAPTDPKSKSAALAEASDAAASSAAIIGKASARSKGPKAGSASVNKKGSTSAPPGAVRSSKPGVTVASRAMPIEPAPVSMLLDPMRPIPTSLASARPVPFLPGSFVSCALQMWPHVPAVASADAAAPKKRADIDSGSAPPARKGQQLEVKTADTKRAAERTKAGRGMVDPKKAALVGAAKTQSNDREFPKSRENREAEVACSKELDNSNDKNGEASRPARTSRGMGIGSAVVSTGKGSPAAGDEAAAAEISVKNVVPALGAGVSSGSTPLMPSFHAEDTGAESDDSSDVNSTIERTACFVCDELTGGDRMVLCDGCSAGCHTFCMRPARISVPLGVWYCPKCYTTAKRHGIALWNVAHFREEHHCFHCEKPRARKYNSRAPEASCADCGLHYHRRCLTRSLKISMEEVSKPFWTCKTCLSANGSIATAVTASGSAKRLNQPAPPVTGASDGMARVPKRQRLHPEKSIPALTPAPRETLKRSLHLSVRTRQSIATSMPRVETSADAVEHTPPAVQRDASCSAKVGHSSASLPVARDKPKAAVQSNKRGHESPSRHGGSGVVVSSVLPTSLSAAAFAHSVRDQVAIATTSPLRTKRTECPQKRADPVSRSAQQAAESDTEINLSRPALQTLAAKAIQYSGDLARNADHVNKMSKAEFGDMLDNSLFSPLMSAEKKRRHDAIDDSALNGMMRPANELPLGGMMASAGLSGTAVALVSGQRHSESPIEKIQQATKASDVRVGGELPCHQNVLTDSISEVPDPSPADQSGPVVGSVPKSGVRVASAMKESAVLGPGMGVPRLETGGVGIEKTPLHVASGTSLDVENVAAVDASCHFGNVDLIDWNQQNQSRIKDNFASAGANSDEFLDGDISSYALMTSVGAEPTIYPQVGMPGNNAPSAVEWMAESKHLFNLLAAGVSSSLLEKRKFESGVANSVAPSKRLHVADAEVTADGIGTETGHAGSAVDGSRAKSSVVPVDRTLEWPSAAPASADAPFRAGIIGRTSSIKPLNAHVVPETSVPVAGTSELQLLQTTLTKPDTDILLMNQLSGQGMATVSNVAPPKTGNPTTVPSLPVTDQRKMTGGVGARRRGKESNSAGQRRRRPLVPTNVDEPIIVPSGSFQNWLFLNVSVGKVFHPSMFAVMPFKSYFDDSIRVVHSDQNGPRAVAFSRLRCPDSDEQLRDWWRRNRVMFEKGPSLYPKDSSLSPLPSAV